jgi:hypothetical protein
MSLTEQQYQELIVLRVGDDAATTLATNIALLWQARSSIADLDIRALQVTVDAIDLMLGRVRGQVDFRGPDGSSVSLSDLFTHLQQMRAQTVAQLASAQAGAGGGVAVGQLTQTAPLMPSGCELDPNAQRYRGDTIRRVR